MNLKQGNWQKYGIMLVPISDYSGSQGLNSRLAESVKPFQHLLFVLQNRSRHALHGYAAVWTWIDANGKLRKTNLANWMFDGPAPHGADLFIGPFGVIGHADLDAGPLVTQQRNLPQLDQDVSIELQFVLLDDGTAIGPEAANIVDRAQGQIRAYKDFEQGLAAIETVEAARAYLQTKVTEPTTSPSPAIGSSAWAYRNHQSSLATNALRWLNNGKDITWIKATITRQAAKMPNYNITVNEEAR